MEEGWEADALQADTDIGAGSSDRGALPSDGGTANGEPAGPERYQHGAFSWFDPNAHAGYVR